MDRRFLKKITVFVVMLLILIGSRSINARAATSYHEYAQGVEKGTVRYVAQSRSVASSNGWGTYTFIADGESGYATQSMAFSYLGINVSPYYLCYGEYFENKWDTGYTNTYDISGVACVSGSGSKIGSLAVNTINTMLNKFISDDGAGEYSPIIVRYGNIFVQHTVLIIGKNSDGSYATLDPAKGMTTLPLTLSSSGSVGGNVLYASDRCVVNSVQQYYLLEATSQIPSTPSIISAVCKNGTSIEVKWTRESSDYQSFVELLDSSGKQVTSFLTESKSWTFSNLSLGTYVIRVSSFSKDGVYSQKVTKTVTISHGHSYVTETTKAKVSKNGSIVKKCNICGSVVSSTIIYYPKVIALSYTSKTYTGSELKPKVTVTGSDGKTIKSSNYTVTYHSNKNPGKASVVIVFKGKYSGSVTKTFTILPKGTSIYSLSAKSKGFSVQWKKQATQITGYEIQYSISSNFSNATIKTYSGTSTVSKTITGLKEKKKYYVRVRTYKIVGKTKYYSSWSVAKKVTTN